MLIRSVTVGLLGLLLTACAGTRDTRVSEDAADTVTGSGLQSVDIRTMAQRMAQEIQETGVLAPTRDGTKASFYIYDMQNESSDTINKTIILNKLRTNLFKAFKGKVRILDRAATSNDLIDAERRMKERGEVSGTNDRKVAGSDFVLTGVIQSRDRQAAALRSSYILVTFRLTDLVSGDIVWLGDYEMKTESEMSVINR